MPFADKDDVVEQLVVLAQDTNAFDTPEISAALNAANARVCAILGTHFVVTGVTSPGEFLKQTEAKLAAILLIRRKYAVRNVAEPKMVTVWMAEVLRDLKNGKLNANDRQALDFGLTALSEPTGAAALAQGVMDDKRASIDRGDESDWWEPADDGTSDDDSPLGSESVNT